MPVIPARKSTDMQSKIRDSLDLSMAERERVIAYRLFSELFAYEITPQILYGLAEECFVYEFCPQLQPIHDRAVGYIHCPEQQAQELAGVFAHLFLGAGGPHSVPPYESAYVSEKGLLFQSPAVEMEEQLMSLGLQISQAFPEPADHISIEFACAAKFAEKNDDQSALKVFLQSHLSNWLADFTLACSKNDRLGFYATVAQSASDFVEAELKRLSTVDAHG